MSKNAADATLVAAQKGKAAGTSVSIDLNFRGKLWKWDESKTARELAQETMRKILPFIDVVIANEEDCHDVLGIKSVDTLFHSLHVFKIPLSFQTRCVLYIFPLSDIDFSPL